jgi:hypothetical protein
VTRRRHRPPPGSSAASWTREELFRVNGRILEPGTEFSVHGEPGRFRFLYATTTPAGAVWVDGIGGPGGAKGVRSWRSFHPEQVRTVHRLLKLRESAA